MGLCFNPNLLVTHVSAVILKSYQQVLPEKSVGPQWPVGGCANFDCQKHHDQLTATLRMSDAFRQVLKVLSFCFILAVVSLSFQALNFYI